MNTEDVLVIVCGECGIEFGMHRTLYNVRSKDGKNWWCPNGHMQCFSDARERAARIDEAKAVRCKLIDGVENWLKSFDEGNPDHDGPTVDDMRTLLKTWREHEARLKALNDEAEAERKRRGG